MIFFENVKGFTQEFKKNKEKGIAYSKLVLSALNKLGYETEAQLVNFGDYGVPQKELVLFWSVCLVITLGKVQPWQNCFLRI